MLPKLQVTLEQGSLVPVGGTGRGHTGRRRALSARPHRRPRPPHPSSLRPAPAPPPRPPNCRPHPPHRSPRPPSPRPRPALTAGPPAQQADAPLLAALRPLQLALVAVGGGVRAAHGRHHAGADALLAHAGGSARLLRAGLADGAEATQHSSARCGWGGRRDGVGRGPAPAASRPTVIMHTVRRPHTCQDLARTVTHAHACPPVFVLALTGTPGAPITARASCPPPLNKLLPPQSLLCPRPPQPRNCGRGIASAPDPLRTQRTDRQPPGRLHHRESASPPQNQSPSSDCDLLLRTPARPAPSLGAAPVSPPTPGPCHLPRDQLLCLSWTGPRSYGCRTGGGVI